ncbi:hypothetical protein [Pectinatus haikarae]|uniref:mRNA-degrading endonuclease toxin of MazEF toxin-antitoxin module n=1 Tax=Pectinatus haikarae TaxID=349096 RepID=A0ABT9Y9S7_9FIRM|nr:hypothetical protein [Pectinatus haikarae]MDQ0204388.1 mRNA-degrading endonuclease toxin of MazEF toxin-antitoxin module [Pectinatus haikarae]
MKQFPESEDIIILNFNTQSGIEIQKNHLMLVVSGGLFNYGLSNNFDIKGVSYACGI